MTLIATEKERVVSMFLRGQSVSDIATFYAVTARTVETVLREALTGLARLNEAMRQPPPAEAVEAMQSEIDLVESK